MRPQNHYSKCQTCKFGVKPKGYLEGCAQGQGSDFVYYPVKATVSGNCPMYEEEQKQAPQGTETA